MNLGLISLERIDGYSCVDRVIHGIAVWLGKDYEMMFAESWGFKYSRDKNNGLVSSGLSDNTGMKYTLLKEYHGIEISEHMGKCTEYELELIKKEISNNKPVIIEVDNYWCPWNFQSYKRYNLLHWLIVIGFDYETQELICIDAELAKGGKRLDKEHFLKASNGYLLLNYGNPKKEICIESILKNAIDRLVNEEKGINIFKQLEELSEDVKLSLDIDKEVLNHESNPIAANLFQKLYQISCGRKHFALTLKYIDEKKNIPEILPIISMLNLASDNWSSIFGMLAKAYYVKDRKKIINKIASKISEVANLEKQIVISIKKILKGDNNLNLISEEKYDNYSDEIDQYSFIDLTNYLNGKGVCIDGGTKFEAELSNPNRYIILKSIPQNGILSVENMKFDINNMAFNNLDNIFCNGQEIDINKENCKCIMFLACSEFSSYTEEVKVIYENDISETLKLKVTSWLSNKPVYDEVVALSGSGAVNSGDKVNVYPFQVSLFAKCYSLKRQGKIKKIIMPNCLNIHIFSITIGF